MHETFRYGTHYRVFDSVEDLIATARRIPESSIEGTSIANRFHRPQVVGRDFSNWEEIYRDAQAPWPEGVQIVERMTAELEQSDLPRPANRRRKSQFCEDDGDELDYDRLRGGQDYWRTTRRESTTGPQTVTIVIDVNACREIKPRDILWRGAAAIAMTHILEEAGFRVELWIVHRALKAYTDDSAHCHAVCLKQAGDPLDISTFTVAASGWFYRSIMFRVKARADRKPTTPLGQPVPPSYYDLQEILPGRDPIVISGAYSYTEAVWIAREALRKLTTPEPSAPPHVETQSTPAPAQKPLTSRQIEQIRKAQEEAMREWEYEYSHPHRGCHDGQPALAGPPAPQSAPQTGHFRFTVSAGCRYNSVLSAVGAASG
jgi:hypothetical protein